ncbi:MAG: asparagine synthase (glutamine-hydrolyzing), partial [Bacteroidetes bacterium CG23_combo_of_CG06-09_8_20_14_all_32_9]
MCGIAGYVSQNYSINDDEFITTLRYLSHRGPDAEGIFRHNNTLLGHKRLSIIDLSASANQPMTSANGRYTIVFNGEIYNFKELAKQYRLNLKTRSDTETILELYAIVGEKLPSLLNGMFAFAIYDHQTGDIILTRDRMGIKPLYYYIDDNIFAFASELKAITKFPYISKKLEINYEAIKNYLHLGYIPQPHSIYKNIKKFPSGNYAFFHNNNLTFSSYWKLNEIIEKDVLSDEKMALKKFNRLLTDSVNLRMFCDVPFGTLLSGGIDSGLVTAIAAKAGNSPVNTYTIGFREQSHNEAPYAARIAKHLNTNHHEYILSEKEAINLIPDILNTYDEPFADSSAIPTMLISKIAATNVKMVLSGDGGDELFHGYGAYKWAKRLANPFYSNLRIPVSLVLKLGNNRYKRISHLFQYRNPDNVQNHIFSQEQYLFSQKEIEQLSGDVLRKTKTFNYFSANTKRILTPTEKQSLFDLQYYLQDDLLVKVDRASMKYSLEVRVPFLDYRIVDFALNLNPSLKIKGNTLKYLLKKLLLQYYPKDFFDRPKKGFSIPLSKWLKNELNYLIDEYLNETAICKTGIFNCIYINVLITRFKNGEHYLYNRLWNLIVLQMFLM